MMIKSKSVRWQEQAACIGKMENAYRISVRKPEGKRPLGRPRYRQDDNIKINLKNSMERMWTGFMWLRI
jgi:hypothetical protein